MRSDSHGTSNYPIPSPNYKLEVNGPIVGRFSAGDIVIGTTQIGFSTVNISYSKVVSIVLLINLHNIFDLIELEDKQQCHNCNKHNNHRPSVLKFSCSSHIRKNIGRHLLALFPLFDGHIQDR